MTNKHEGHIATCLCCKNLELSNELDWSEVTPGDGFVCFCRAGINFFEYNAGERSPGVETPEFHIFHKLGENCESFDGR